jgi:4-amino-4-deoxy-L-arabinose transferase-like glycosyltransferase
MLPGKDMIAPIAAGSSGPSAGYPALVARVVASLVASRMRGAAGIIFVALLCLLPGIATTPPVDRDEPANAVASRQMLVAGDLLTIPVPAEWTAARGPAIYWVQAGAVMLFGGGEDAPMWVYRVPSLLAGIAAALLTWWAALAFRRPRAAFLAGLTMAACLMLAGEARVARPDAIFLPALILAQGSLARLWLAEDGRKRDWLHIGLFWTGLAAAMAASGFLGPLIVVLTIAVLCTSDRSARWLRRLSPIAGVSWLLILVLPWLLATNVLGNGRPFLAGFSGWDAVTGFFAPPRGFNPPPGFYLLLFFLTFWPGAAFVGLGVSRFLDNLRRPVVLFGLAWCVPFWLLCEAARVKFPDLVLPAYPALALLAGAAIDEAAIDLSGRLRRIIAAGPVGVPLIFLVVVPLLLFLIDGTIPWLGLVFLFAAIAIGYFGWRQLLAGDTLSAFATSLGAALVLYFGVFGVMLPSSPALDTSRRAVALAANVAGCMEPELAAAGYIEPSLRFLGGDRTVLGASGGAADFLAGAGCRVAIVEAAANEAFLSRAEDIGLQVRERGRLQGYAVPRGRFVTLILYTAAKS